MLQLIARPWLSADALSVVGGGRAACRIGVRTFRNDHGGAVRVFYPGYTEVEQKATKKARIFRCWHDLHVYFPFFRVAMSRKCTMH